MEPTTAAAAEGTAHFTLHAPPARARVLERPRVEGRFLFAGAEKLHVRGVTYGTFRPNADGHEFPEPDVVERDFAAMAAAGVNAVRIYTPPAPGLLDAAARHGLRVMVGLAAERVIGHLNDRGGYAKLEAAVREGVLRCGRHPAVLCYALGNEIPAPVVRWLGPERVERALARLAEAVREEDPDGLVTYANYPTTEYLRLPFLDFVAFNVYLEDPERLRAYLGRLHNVAQERPLLMTELGLDSERNGELAQARAVATQVRVAFDGGCAGAFVYAWTDEWHRGGEDVHDWSFGLVDRERAPKPALHTAARVFSGPAVSPGLQPPRVSVVVCTHNGARTLADCLEGAIALDYPDHEVLVVADGCTDASAAIAAEYGVRVLTTPPLGLSHARNVGMVAATGQIVAYIDDDARPDRDWLTFAVRTLQETDHAGVGGPNIAPPRAPATAQCVDNSPGNPTHVLLSDQEAEHIPGCNMVFWRDRLQAVGGFDRQFRSAGDDVDICWRLQERGWTLGFSPAAVVLHRRRGTLRGYLRQQRGYGRAEAMLERKWPEKYNRNGHMLWRGRLYARGACAPERGRIDYGVWGEGLFQRLYPDADGTLRCLARSPEWYLVIAVLAGLCLLSLAWPPLLWLSPLLALAAVLPLADAAVGARQATFDRRTGRARAAGMRLFTAGLHLAGPLARLAGRIGGGLTPWRRRGARMVLPLPRRMMLWATRRREMGERLAGIEASVRGLGGGVQRGGSTDRWDLSVHGGLLARALLLGGLEEQGGGTQLVRLRIWPSFSRGGLFLAAALAALATAAGLDGALPAAAVLAGAAALLLGRAAVEAASACGVLHAAVEAARAPEEEPMRP